MAVFNRIPSPTPTAALAATLLCAVAICLAGCGRLYEVNNPPAGWLSGGHDLVEARFLLPLTDKAGRPFPRDRVVWVESELTRRYGGFVNEGDIERESKSPYIAPVREQVRRYMISLRRDQEEGLKNFLKTIKKQFGQREIYLTLDRDQGFWL